jgi:flagellar protein FlaG
MSFDLSGVDASRAAQVPPTRASTPAAAARSDFARTLRAQQPAVTSDAIPASPPPEVLAEMRAAQKAVDDMHARGRQLHFEMAGGRLRIELQDLDGNVLRTIPASQALQMASGRIVR